ncbi:MAG: L,D-transpeptidase family protein, partial [Algoriphagus sp.]
TLGQDLLGQDFSSQLRITLEKITQESPARIRERQLTQIGLVFPFYSQRQFEPIWTKQGKLTSLAYELRFEIRQVRDDALNPESYHLALIENFFESHEKKLASGSPIEGVELAELELLLSDAYFRLALDLDLGRVDPSKLKAKWGIPRKTQSQDYGVLLSQAARDQDLRTVLISLYPNTPSYSKGKLRLRQLEEYTQKQGAWKPIKSDRTIRLGESSPILPQVRERLAFWGFSSKGVANDPKLFDSLLFDQVQTFQIQRGLKTDGVLGQATFVALNISPMQLMDKIRVNLERMRWVPAEFFEKEAILVNVPSFQVVYRRGMDTLFSTKVIVGTVKNQTPVFTSLMSYLVLSPYWNIPPSIARKETLPAIRRNPGYLNANHMEVVTTAGQPVSLSQVNWKASPFPYLIRQKPGEHNALGLVKFMFPNPFNVYLHDTPSKQLFEREIRAFSHGCIRMEHPETFAALLLKDRQEWPLARMQEVMHQGKEEIVPLTNKIPVAILYFTFLVSPTGTPVFYEDIYGRDEELLLLLKN